MNQLQLQKIVQAIVKNPPHSEAALLLSLRREAGKFKQPSPAKSNLLAAYQQLLKTKKIQPCPPLRKLLVKRAVRTLSGVAVITVLTKPYPCPGKCIYCPTEKGMPKSYLSNEPAAQRAFNLKFNPQKMVELRIRALEANGHEVDKIELIVLGGTWSAYPRSYQDWFITQCFYAANTYGKKTKRRAKNLATEQKINETAKYKIIGLTLETRPDCVTPDEVKQLRRLGCTRVQLGIQHTDDKILKLIKRGQTLADAIAATRMLKETGFKVDHHYMPDLPTATPAKDLKMFKYVFDSADLQPDQVKIYPCIVNQNSVLYHWYKTSRYKPYSPRQLLELLLKIKKLVPPYVRINRLVRDIPIQSIVAGNKITNLRQYLKKLSEEQGWQCQCLNCREVRNRPSLKPKNYPAGSRDHLSTITYQASQGTEHFLSFESKDKKIIYAFLRLRFNDNPEKNILSELKNAALIRELHVYGQMIPARKNQENKKSKNQHRGFGLRLMAEAEKLARENGYKKIAVIAGIGVRNYYRKLGYQQQGTYLIKNLAKKRSATGLPRRRKKQR